MSGHETGAQAPCPPTGRRDGGRASWTGVEGEPRTMTEAARLAALHEYGVLDTPADAELTALVQAAAVVAGVPTATLNLIDDRRQCQLTTVGFAGADGARDDSMCAVVFEGGTTIQVPDARLDPRFAANPWVTGRLGTIRFYAAAPLITGDGHALGTLCVFDTVPRRLEDARMTALEGLAGVVMALFERRREARHKAELAAEAHRQRTLAEAYLRRLQERQELLDAVQDTIDVGIVACDAGGRWTLANRAARRWYGIGADGPVDEDGTDRCGLFAADGATPLPADQTPLHRALHDGAVERTEMVVVPAEGDPVRVLCSGRALTHPDGTLLGAVVAMTDITADHAHRQEIVDRQRLLAAVVDTAPDAFVVTDNAGVVTAWNPAAEKMFGWPAAEAVGRRLEHLIIPAHLGDAHARGLARRAATGEARLSSDVQVPAVRRDGTGLLAELSLGSFSWHGERRFHAFLRDVTDRENARRRIAQANQDLARANEELDRFTAMVAHDLKSPLAAIAGYAELLEDSDTGRGSDVALSAIGRATARMSVMIDSLLDHARAVGEPVVRQPVDLDTMVDELTAEMEAATTRPFRITRTTLPVVPAHPALLRQVLANLLGNAVKYVSPAVEPRVHVHAEAGQDGVTIAVTDNGIGIPREAWDRVFTMFRREAGSHSPGSGIGLATCRRIVHRHEGRIWVDSSSGAGTAVKVTLPHLATVD